jgi:hypothetical protein
VTSETRRQSRRANIVYAIVVGAVALGLLVWMFAAGSFAMGG